MIATIGFFDGMHEGHRYVISQVTELAEKRGDGAIIFTFDRHPASLFCPEKAPRLLLTPEEKMQKIDECCVDDIVMFEFDEELASLTTNEFLQILKEDYAVNTLLLGYDNHFGRKEKDAEGNVINPTFDDYVQRGKEEGVRIKRLQEFKGNGDRATTTSSTLIRDLLLNGNLQEANMRLGYNYMLTGRVVSGYQIGRKIGFPTANIEVPVKVIPKNGVYATYATTAKTAGKLKAIVNIGSRPTFNGNERTIEVHILDFHEDIYDAEISIEFVARLRDEMKFDSPEELILQISKDKAIALEIL